MLQRVRNRLLLRKLTADQSKTDGSIQGLVTFARVSWTQLGKPRDGCGVFPARKHQGQHLLRIERAGLAAQPRSRCLSPRKGEITRRPNSRDAAWQKAHLKRLKLNFKKIFFAWKDHSLSSMKSCKSERIPPAVLVASGAAPWISYSQSHFEKQISHHLKHSHLFSMRFVCYCCTCVLWLTPLSTVMTSELYRTNKSPSKAWSKGNIVYYFTNIIISFSSCANPLFSTDSSYCYI